MKTYIVRQINEFIRDPLGRDYSVIVRAIFGVIIGLALITFVLRLERDLKVVSKELRELRDNSNTNAD